MTDSMRFTIVAVPAKEEFAEAMSKNAEDRPLLTFVVLSGSLGRVEFPVRIYTMSKYTRTGLVYFSGCDKDGLELTGNFFLPDGHGWLKFV